MSALEVIGASRRFGDEVAVDGVDISVGHGEIHAIVGLNGAGKTTLMRLLTGMVIPDAGTVRVGGREVARADWSTVGHMIETPNGYPELTVRQNVEVAARLRGVIDVDDYSDSAIEMLGLEYWARRRARDLSLGNRQRLGLACAIVHRPNILILDEPANALDPAGVVLVRDLMREWAGEGVAVLVSSHHLDQMARVAQRITVMHRGRMVGSIDPAGSDLEERFFATVHEADLRATGGRHA